MSTLRWVAVSLTLTSLAWCLGVGVLVWRGSFRPGDIIGISALLRFGGGFVVLPNLLAALAAWSAWRGRFERLPMTTVFLLLVCIVTGFGPGIIYMPAVGALAIAALLGLVARHRQAGGAV